MMTSGKQLHLGAFMRPVSLHTGAWLEKEGSDGVNVVFPYLPQGLDDVVDHVVPELQRRGLFRKDYAGETLREHLGLPRPANRYF